MIINLSIIFTRKVKIGNTWKFDQATYLRGRGKIEIGDNCSFGFKRGGFHKGGAIEIQTRLPTALVKLGSFISTNNNIFICSAKSINIGDNCLIGQFVTIMDFEAHRIEPNRRRQIGLIGTIDIKENVWIGNNVIILKNTSIGANSIVAAGAVVSGNFPDNVIIGGVPAKIINKIDDFSKK